MLYFCVNGTNLGPNGRFLFNCDGNAGTGYLGGGWSSTGFDCMVENKILFRYAGTGYSWNWVVDDAAALTITSVKAEGNVPLSSLGTLAPIIKVVYMDMDASYQKTSQLPVSGEPGSYSLK
jgi:hypothetical protein